MNEFLSVSRTETFEILERTKRGLQGLQSAICNLQDAKCRYRAVIGRVIAIYMDGILLTVSCKNY